jgi:hypothetical protein
MQQCLPILASYSAIVPLCFLYAPRSTLTFHDSHPLCLYRISLIYVYRYILQVHSIDMQVRVKMIYGT